MKFRPLMVLGSGSDVGKSVLVAGLCRLFRQEGVRVAPFKAQNMALNSFITREGGEMGRAQVVQARAAGLAPQVDMNPILLKPSSEVGSQVIVHGRVLGNYTARDYYRLKPKLVRQVMASFRRLSRTFDLIILEGAGSAVELNLKQSDLVNFAMARRAGAAVILVADIERGGVFAATIGAFHLLTRSERLRLQGFVINKFRGDPELFREGVEIIRRRTGRPVLGVLPFLPDLALPEEDSVALARKRRAAENWQTDGLLRVGVVRLPHISNYTDFDPLEREPGVSLRYLEAGDDWGGAHLIILPGTKNTLSDLRWLKASGLAQRLLAFARGGGRILGVCGGYQMLGEEVRDPLGVEGPPGAEPGLGLLPVVTTMAPHKTTTQVSAQALAGAGKGHLLEAYEIHMGFTQARGDGEAPFAITAINGRPAAATDGWLSPDGRVCGTYLHGLFDSDAFRRAFLRDLAPPQWGETGLDALSFLDFQDKQLDRLAEVLRRHLNLAALWDMIRT